MKEVKCRICGEDLAYGFENLISLKMFLHRVMTFSSYFFRCVKCRTVFKIKEFLEGL